MKKLLVCLSFMPAAMADMVYDPIKNVIYSTPLANEIHQEEYLRLLYVCSETASNMAKMLNGNVTTKDLLKHMKPYLVSIGSATAMRLLKDLEKGYMYYPDGSIAKKMD